MLEKISKEHEINVLTSVFEDSKEFFERLGYKDYVFRSRSEDGIPDGIFQKGRTKIWVEHTQILPNYGKSHSLSPGFDGFCKDVRRELSKMSIKGCFCFDISSSMVDQYFKSPTVKSDILSAARKALKGGTEYIDENRSICIKYCSPEVYGINELNEYNGLRVAVSQFHHLDLCRLLSRDVYDKLLDIKTQKYKKNSILRKENWLFVEVPWGYALSDNLPDKSDYFNKIFIVEICSNNGKEYYKPRLLANKDMNTWLFTWNPKRYQWNDTYFGHIELKSQVLQVGHAFSTWSCGVNKSIVEGDRVFLIRLGEEPRGIMASGYAASCVFEGPHWDLVRAGKGDKSKRIYIEFDKILDPFKDNILHMQELKGIAPDFCWSSQSSGIKISKEIADEIEKSWGRI